MQNDVDEINEQFRELIANERGEYEKLAAYAQKELRRRNLHRLYSGTDILHEAYLKLINHQRIWDKSKVSDFVRFMYMVVKSMIGNMAVLKRHIKSIDDDEYKIVLQSNDTILEDKELEEFHRCCLDKLKDIPHAQEIYRCFTDGMTNKETAEQLELPISEVENMKKRLKRYIPALSKRYYGKELKSSKAAPVKILQ